MDTGWGVLLVAEVAVAEAETEKGGGVVGGVAATAPTPDRLTLRLCYS